MRDALRTKDFEIKIKRRKLRCYFLGVDWKIRIRLKGSTIADLDLNPGERLRDVFIVIKRGTSGEIVLKAKNKQQNFEKEESSSANLMKDMNQLRF